MKLLKFVFSLSFSSSLISFFIIGSSIQPLAAFADTHTNYLYVSDDASIEGSTTTGKLVTKDTSKLNGVTANNAEISDSLTTNKLTVKDTSTLNTVTANTVSTNGIGTNSVNATNASKNGNVTADTLNINEGSTLNTVTANTISTNGIGTNSVNATNSSKNGNVTADTLNINEGSNMHGTTNVDTLVATTLSTTNGIQVGSSSNPPAGNVNAAGNIYAVGATDSTGLILGTHVKAYTILEGGQVSSAGDVTAAGNVIAAGSLVAQTGQLKLPKSSLSGTYTWTQGNSPVQMIPENDGFCFLTMIQGQFEGGGERVKIYISGGYWYLGGDSHQSSVGGSAMCFKYQRI